MVMEVSSEGDVDLLSPLSFSYGPEDDDVAELRAGSVKSLQDWGFEEVRVFLDERPMSLHMECFEIVDGRVLSVLTDETLQELGVSKRLHRLVLINKIAKEKARSQQHALLQAALVRMIQTMRDSHQGNNENEDNNLAAMQRRVQDLVSSLSVNELILEMRTKGALGGCLCELLFYMFSLIFMPKIFTIDSRAMMFADEEVTKLVVRRLKKKPPPSEHSYANSLRVLFILMRNDDNRYRCSISIYSLHPNLICDVHRSFAVGEGAIETVIAVMDNVESMGNAAKIQILGLALLMSFSYTAENQATIVKSNGIKTILRVLSSTDTCERIHEYGFRLLWLFAQDPSHHDLIIEQDVVATAISGMAAHRRRAGIQEHGCGLIRSLCFKVMTCKDASIHRGLDA